MSAVYLHPARHIKLLNSQKHRPGIRVRAAACSIVTKACTAQHSKRLYLGLDFGTSGARAICIDGVAARHELLASGNDV